jgi:hypothetical protein
MIVTSSRRPCVSRKNTEAAAIVMQRDALISPATSSVLGLRAGMTPFLCAGSFSYARESVETIPFTINLNLSLSDAAASWFRNCLRRDDCSTLSCPMKFNLRSLADAGKRAPSPRTRWCSYCKRNEHHLCSGTRRVNHGRTVPCECPHRDRHDPNRRLALNRPPPISLRTNTAVGRSCYLVADQAHPELSKEEVGILDLLARGLSREFPNPQRVGCPSSKVLRDIAFRKLPLPGQRDPVGETSSFPVHCPEPTPGF